MTLTLKRGQSYRAAKRLGKRLRGGDPYPRAYELIHITQPLFSDAVDVFERYDDQRLTFTDATTVAFARAHGIDTVLSFDGLVDRTDPAALAGEHNP